MSDSHEGSPEPKVDDLTEQDLRVAMWDAIEAAGYTVDGTGMHGADAYFQATKYANR